MAKWKEPFKRCWQLIAKIPILLLLIIVFVVGYKFSTAVNQGGPASQNDSHADHGASESEEIWTCSMHPQIRLPEQGKCPICGMDLILTEDSPKPAKTASEKKPLYACSMFCLPPQPNAGKCQICGMEMVEVDVDDSGEGDAVRTLTLSPAAQKLAEITTEPVSRKFVAAEIRMVGKVNYDETRLKHITAWVPGRLERLYVDYTGIPVKQGDHMVYLYSPDLATAQAELLQALDRAKGATGEQGSLVNRRATDWLEDIRDKFRLWGLTDDQISEIETRGTSTDYMTINAPMGGIVIHKNAVEGMYVNTGTRIYTIADLTRVWIKLEAYESDLQWLRYGQELEFETEAYPGELFKGRVAFIDPILDAKTRTVKLRVNVDNADGRLKPEMFVRAIVHSKIAEGGRIIDAELAGKWISPMHPEIIKDEPGTCDVCGMPLVRAESLDFVSVETGDATPPLVIPASAPLKTGKRTLIYLAIPDAPGRFEGREIVLGPRAGDYYIVKEGLAEGEQLVVHGNFKIDSAMQIVAKPSMMNPAGGGSAPGHHHAEHAGQQLQDTLTVLPEPRSEIKQPVTAMAVPASFRAQLDPAYLSYVKMQAALSRDDLDGAKEAAKSFQADVTRADMTLLNGDAHNLWMKELGQLSTTTEMIGRAKTIDDARFSFALISEGTIAVAKHFGAGDLSLHRFHCPMAFDGRGADWLQVKERTENPFFGSAMFRCGTLEETITTSAEDLQDGDSNGEP